MVVSQQTQPLHVLSCYVIHVHNNKIVTDFVDVLVGGSHQLAVVPTAITSERLKTLHSQANSIVNKLLLRGVVTPTTFVALLSKVGF